jgi:hypothetical protein
MTTTSQRPNGRENAVSLLNAAIDAMDLAEKISSITPAKAVFGTVSILLAMIKVRFLFFRCGVFQVDT